MNEQVPSLISSLEREKANVDHGACCQMWELALTSLRSSLRQSLHSSPLGVSQAVLVQKAGGPAAVRRDILRLIAEAVVRKARVREGTRILGLLGFEGVGLSRCQLHAAPWSASERPASRAQTT